jgi:recombination protein RecT
MATTEPTGIAAYLNSIAPKLEQAATRHLSPDRLIRVFLGLAARNPKIYECSRASIVEALSLCNQTGLEPGGTLGQAYLIPRWNKHTRTNELNFQPGYKGLATLARRSGEVERINAAPVYQWELDRGLFEYSHEPPDIRHQWVADPPKSSPQDIVGAWAVAILKDGMRVQVWLSREQIEKRRAQGSSKGGVWDSWYAEMCRKTALRALLNGGMVPISTELAAAMEHDPDSWTREAPERTTAAQRRIGMFRTEPEPIETTAEVVGTLAEGVADGGICDEP